MRSLFFREFLQGNSAFLTQKGQRTVGTVGLQHPAKLVLAQVVSLNLSCSLDEK